MFQAAVDRAAPATCLPENLPPPLKGRTIVIGAGKAAAAMASAVEAHWPGKIEGLVVTRYGHGAPTREIEVVEAAHPVPDAAGQAAARRILDLAQVAGPDDLVLCLVSGGGSALLTLPPPGIALADKRTVNDALLKSGAPIDAMNCVRKHLSAIKGGRLAAAVHPALLVSLMISDVPGDDPSVIASGPTVPDPTTCADALAVLERFAIAAPAAVVEHLRSGRGETPKPGDAVFSRVMNRVIARPQASLEAAAAVAVQAGYRPVLLGDALEGEARELGQAHAKLALGHRGREAVALISGGETTVTVRGTGRGGRNVEYLLGMALGLDGATGVAAIACDTDGIDGTEDNAGAVIRPDTLVRARALNLDPAASLANNDAYGLFRALGDLIITGPTLTNVNDFRAILVESAAEGVRNTG